MDWLPGRTVTAVRVLDARILGTTSARVVPPSAAGELARTLTGAVLGDVARRGKYMWVPLNRAEVPAGVAGSVSGAGEGPVALALHLGMSGQVRIHAPGDAMHPHTRVVIDVDSGGSSGGPVQVRFVDQRIFGHVGVEPVGWAFGRAVVVSAARIAPDPFEDVFDARVVARVMQRRNSAVKTVLTDQSVVSGIGNIYADEALFLAGVHPLAVAARLQISRLVRTLSAAQDVMERALVAGGTSFDSLYVNVTGESGYFERSLNVYGRLGQPCVRCGQEVRRTVVGGRGTHFCPRCQPVQRVR